MIPEQFRRQLSDLNRSHPASWPRLPRRLFCCAPFFLTVLVGWHACLRPDIDALDANEKTERMLKETYPAKLMKAARLTPLQQQSRQISRHIGMLEDRLLTTNQTAQTDSPDILLREVSDAASRHALQLESAKPGKPTLKQGYVEIPVELRLSGRYHDLGRFAADIAGYQHLVILSNLHLSAEEKTGVVTMKATLLSYGRDNTGNAAGASFAPPPLSAEPTS